MTEWVVEIDDYRALLELWAVLRVPDPPPPPDRVPLIKYQVASFDGLKVEIFSNEHGPPHFRVSYDGKSANYRISDCERIAGDLGRHEAKIRWWHGQNKKLLIETWDARRPTDCPVGKYREN